MSRFLIVYISVISTTMEYLKRVFTAEFIGKILLEVVLLGLLVTAIQECSRNKYAPLTAEETLRRENLLNAKQEIYRTAVDLMNRNIAVRDFVTLNEDGKADTAYKTKKPSEIEINNCVSYLMLYANDKVLVVRFKRFFQKGSDFPVASRDSILSLIRSDLDKDAETMTFETSEGMYLRLRDR